MSTTRTIILGLALAGAIFAVVPTVDAQTAPACTTPATACEGADGYYVSSDDRDKLAPLVEPILLELRACLDSVGAKHVRPAVVLRFDSAGKAVEGSVDAPGYESSPCVKKIAGKLTTLKNPHETKVKCDYGCPKPPPASVSPPATSAMADAGPPPDAGPEPAPVVMPVTPPPPVDEGRKYEFSVKVQGGYEPGLMYGVGINSGRMRLGFGRQNDELGQYVIIDGRYGTTSGGLKNGDLRLGGELDLYRGGILHLGLGGGAGILLVERATSGEALFALTLGMHLHGGLDIIRWGPRKRSAITLDVRLPIDLYFTGYYFGPGAFLGVRL